MLDGRWRANVERGLEPVGKGLQRAGINPDVLTVIGLAFAVGTAFLIASGHLVLAVFGVIATGLGPIWRMELDATTIALVEKIETLDPVDVNQVSGTGKPQLEHWDKALSTGQHLAFIAELIEERERLLRGLRRVIVKRRWQH